jgi:hypothetical protein
MNSVGIAGVLIEIIAPSANRGNFGIMALVWNIADLEHIRTIKTSLVMRATLIACPAIALIRKIALYSDPP